ncbi:MAG: MFS transporter [Chitinophagaceae bacterium]|jgi:MFS transporter, PPP family, 3-phenylpropionic acid transporter|nr:MFS transporter [Chitinophagaceae bacterium]
MSKATTVRIIYFLVFCCTGAWLPKLYDYCIYKGLTGPQSALILSITPIMMFAVQPLYGFFADKLGYKKTLLFSTLLASISYLGFLLNVGFTELIIVTIIMSLFYNTIQPVLDSMALQIAKTNHKFSYGSLRFYGAAGFAFTTIITGQVIDAVDITVIFMVSSVTMFSAFIFCFFLKDEVYEKTTVNAYSNVWGVIKNPPLIILLCCVFLVSLSATTIWNFYSAYLKENGATDSLVGYGLSFQGLCELPIFYFSTRIILKLGLKTTLLITILSTAIRMSLYSIIKTPVATLPVELLHGLSWSLFWVVCVEYVNMLVDERWLATGQSLLYAAYFGAGAIAGNYWTEYFLSNGMKLSEIFLLNAGIIFLTGIGVWIFMQKKSAGNIIASAPK